MLLNNRHRINRNILFQISDELNVSDFFKLKDEINSGTYQYVENDSLFESGNILQKTIWDSGDFAYRLNKGFSNNCLFVPQQNIQTYNLPTLNISIFLRQGFVWSSNVLGFHCIIKSATSNETLCSQLLTSNDFSFSNISINVSGAFWSEEAKIKIPKTNETLLVEVYQINYSDISSELQNIGYIYNYVSELIPLINEKPIPDYITTSLKLNLSNFLTVEIKTSENKTLQQSILDYFSQVSGNINISHIIKYGTEILGFKSLRVSNEVDKFSAITIALDFSEFATQSNDLVDIYVNSEITVDNKLMQREAHITTNLLSVINPLVVDKITHPETNYPVNVTIENTINNTIIETKTVEKIIPIYQPIYTELIRDNIVYNENKNIYFDTLKVPAYLQVGDNDVIMSRLTVDGKYYFDLSTIQQLTEQTIYLLLDINSMQVIGKGIIEPVNNKILLQEKLKTAEISSADVKTIAKLKAIDSEKTTEITSTIPQDKLTIIDDKVVIKPVTPFITPEEPRNVNLSAKIVKPVTINKDIFLRLRRRTS